MSRKDYELVARAIRQQVEMLRASNGSADKLGVAAIEGAAGQIASAMASDNSSFNRARFMQACGF